MHQFGMTYIRLVFVARPVAYWLFFRIKALTGPSDKGMHLMAVAAERFVVRCLDRSISMQG